MACVLVGGSTRSARRLPAWRDKGSDWDTIRIRRPSKRLTGSYRTQWAKRSRLLLFTHLARLFVIPIVVVAVELWATVETRLRRPGSRSRLTREDWVFGLNWMAGAVVSLLIFASDRTMAHLRTPPVNAELERSFIHFLLNSTAIFVLGVATMVVVPKVIAKRGYSRPGRGHKKELTLGWGIMFPNVVGMLLLVAASSIGVTSS